jgi:HEAT repeat protein
MRRPALALSVVVALAAIARAASDADVDQAIAAFKKAFASKDESARLEAVSALSKQQGKKVVDALEPALVRDPMPSVRREAAKAISGEWTPAAPAALLKALEGAPPEVGAAIVEALGRTESETAVPALVGLLKPKAGGRGGRGGAGAAAQDSGDVTGPAIAALRKIGSPRAADDLIGFYEKSSRSGGRSSRRGGGGGNNSDPNAEAAKSALQAITGQSWSTAAEWRKWWNESGAALKLVKVYRCESTGQTFEKDPKKPCPFDGEQHPKCGYFLVSRIAGFSPGSDSAPSSSSNNNGGKKGGRRGGNNGGGNNGGDGKGGDGDGKGKGDED